MTATRATAALDRCAVDYRLRRYRHDPRAQSFGAEAVAQTGLGADVVFKTLVVDAGALAFAVVPVAGRLDLKAVAQALGAKRATLADPRAAERATGYPPGAITALGARTALPCLLEAGARSHPTLVVSAGRRGANVELAVADYVRLTSARFADLALTK